MNTTAILNIWLTTALINPKDPSWPNISTYNNRTKNSRAFFLLPNPLLAPLFPPIGVPMFGMGDPGDIVINPPPPLAELPSSFFFRVSISEAMIRSSSCLDLDSPMALMSSKNSLERCIPDILEIWWCCWWNCYYLAVNGVSGFLSLQCLLRQCFVIVVVGFSCGLGGRLETGIWILSHRRVWPLGMCWVPKTKLQLMKSSQFSPSTSKQPPLLRSALALALHCDHLCGRSASVLYCRL